MKASTTEERAMSCQRREQRSVGERLACALLAGLTAALVAGALPAAASAADYCVAPNTTCGGTNVASFEQALDLADNATDADRIFLGAATYTSAPNSSGFDYLATGSPVEIVGQGEGHTIVTAPAGEGSDFVLGVFGGPGTSVHDLTIRLPQNAAVGAYGLMTDNAARRIEVVEDPTQLNRRTGIGLQHGAALEDSTVTLGSVQDTTAVALGPGGGTVRRSALSARFGVLSDYGGTIERSRLTAAIDGIWASRGVTTITGSLIRTMSGDGIFTAPQAGYDVSVKADGITIVAPAPGSTLGAAASTAFAPTHSADVSLRNSVIRGVSRALYAAALGTGQAKISASYSDYDPSGNFPYGANATISGANVSNVGDAGFVDQAGGNYHLRPGSALVDRGDPATAQGLDLDGNPLVADGNGDGIARRDLGAFELQPAAPAGAGGGQQAGGGSSDNQPPLVSGF